MSELVSDQPVINYGDFRCWDYNMPGGIQRRCMKLPNCEVPRNIDRGNLRLPPAFWDDVKLTDEQFAKVLGAVSGVVCECSDCKFIDGDIPDVPLFPSINLQSDIPVIQYGNWRCFNYKRTADGKNERRCISMLPDCLMPVNPDRLGQRLPPIAWDDPNLVDEATAIQTQQSVECGCIQCTDGIGPSTSLDLLPIRAVGPSAPPFNTPVKGDLTKYFIYSFVGTLVAGTLISVAL